MQFGGDRRVDTGFVDELFADQNLRSATKGDVVDMEILGNQRDDSKDFLSGNVYSSFEIPENSFTQYPPIDALQIFESGFSNKEKDKKFMNILRSTGLNAPSGAGVGRKKTEMRISRGGGDQSAGVVRDRIKSRVIENRNSCDLSQLYYLK